MKEQEGNGVAAFPHPIRANAAGGNAVMKKRLGRRFLALIVFWALAFLALPAEAGVWRMDGSAAAELPRNFRFAGGAWQRDFTGEAPDRTGLDTLFASASGQPSRDGIAVLYRHLTGIAPAGATIYLFDLRQESHGFADGLPVSWYEEKNRANDGRSDQEIAEDETTRLAALTGLRTIFQPLGHEDEAALKPRAFAPRTTEDERTVAEAAGFRYVRLTAADMVWPEAPVVDEFLRLTAGLPENAWLHFHCQAGRGRATTFLVMYDILKNPGLPLEEIARRQTLLGGSDLLVDAASDDWYTQQHRHRAAMLRLFYVYAGEQRGAAKPLRWSEWLSARDNA